MSHDADLFYEEEKWHRESSFELPQELIAVGHGFDSEALEAWDLFTERGNIPTS